jgi:preprotein translocase subunit SecF
MNTQQNKGLLNFMRFRPLYYALSLVVILPGVYSLIRYGLRPSIDFTGGTLLEIQLPAEATTNEDLIRNSAPEEVEIGSVQSAGPNAYVVRAKTYDKDLNEQFKFNIASAAGLLATTSAQINPASLVQELRFETVGPTLGAELIRKTLTAVAMAAIGITLYIAYRFKDLKYGICAILAMFHDTLVVLGIFSLLGVWVGVEVDTLFVTAVLTTLSFSVHDTIVVYNKIRESRKRYPSASLQDLVNVALAETMARSINNSMTIVFMLLALVLFGGDTVKWFVVALLIGTISGTYSSPFVAVPLLIEWDKLGGFRKKALVKTR